MHLNVPEGAVVHIMIGPKGVPLLAAPDTVPAAVSPTAAPRRRWRWAKGIALGILVVGSYELGARIPRPAQPAAVPAAQAALPAAPAAALPEQRPFPDRPAPRLASAPTATATASPPVGSDVPPAFRDGLRQAPTVTPPPGQAAGGSGAAGAAGPNPFGLRP